MKAVIYKKYGSPEVLQLVEVATPQPKDNEILVKILATSVTSGDARLRSCNFPVLAWLPVRLMFGLFRPRKQILGHEFSGVVEAVGKDVTQYQVGDEILATPTMLNTGSYAEYICVPQDRTKGVLGLKPKTLSFNEAAVLPVGGMTAMFLLDKAGLAKGQNVLIYGASGSVGSYAIQIAKALQVSVVAVCSGANLDMVKSLGADSAIDYKKEDYSRLNDRFDIVFDAVGHTTKAQAQKVLKPDGRYISVNALTSPTQEHLNKLLALAEQGKIKPYIDQCFPFKDTASAHEYVDSGRKKGNVVIEVAGSAG